MSYELKFDYIPQNRDSGQGVDSVTGRFVRGHTPWNKGRDCAGLLGGNTKFKPGDIPKNAKHNGAVSVRFHKRDGRYYKFIRVMPGKWVLLHRYVWEKHNGCIPVNHVLRFKDSDTLNCDISNLECVSRSENLTRNRNVKKAARSLSRTWQKTKVRYYAGLSPATKWGERAEKGRIKI